MLPSVLTSFLGVKACCDNKTVGDVEYLLVGQDSAWTGYYGCKDDCIYRRQELKDIIFLHLFIQLFWMLGVNTYGGRMVCP
jgi:hypothetical protein